MHKSLFTVILALVGFFGYAVAYGQSSTPSLCVKAFERNARPPNKNLNPVRH